MSSAVADADVVAEAVRAQLIGARADLERLVRMPSISAAAAHVGDVQAAAEQVRSWADQAGAGDSRLVDAGGAPAVVARWPAPDGAPTVLLYAHLDVQPTGGDENWTTPPFAPSERGGRLYGRGAADDKAGVLLHLAVLRAFSGRPPVGVTLFVEGEEEIGSPTLPALLAANVDLLRSDVIVIADSANAAVDVPSFTTSLRGLVDLSVEVRMLAQPVHSGMFGGAVPDALTGLCRLLASLHDDAGDVAVPGLVRQTSAAPDVDPAVLAGDAGMCPGVELIGTGTIPERLWMRPAVSVLGIDAPAVADASNVLLPRARAKVSLRLAPGDDATAATVAITDHLKAHAPWGAEVVVVAGAAGDPYSLSATGDVYDMARRAYADAFGAEVVETGIGGSIPFIAEFARTYPGATVMVTGVGDPASRWHGIDESLDLGMWEKATVAEALFLQRLGLEESDPQQSGPERPGTP